MTVDGIPWRAMGWGAAGFLLLLPAVTNAPWTTFDYIFAGTVFVIVGGVFELAVWRSPSWSYRTAVAIALVCAVFHVWFTGAVGIIGNEDNPGNLLYLAVVVTAIFGAIVTLGRAPGMVWVMAVAAVAEIFVPIIAYAGVADPREPVLRPEVFICGAVFTGMWLLSAALFRNAARRCPHATVA